MHPVMIPILIMVGLFVLMGVIVYVNHLREKRRTQELTMTAAGLSFEFFPEGRPALTAALGRFHLFGQGHSRKLWNLMQGVANGLEISIFDYQFVVGHGKNRQIFLQSVFCAQRDGMDLPGFTMRPETFWHKIGSLFGNDDIDFESHPDFSKAYMLRGPIETAIRDLFTDDVLSYFESKKGLSVEGHRDTLLYYKSSRLQPEEARAFMSEGFEVLNVLSPADSSERRSSLLQ
jgi:hypothetical protein